MCLRCAMPRLHEIVLEAVPPRFSPQTYRT